MSERVIELAIYVPESLIEAMSRVLACQGIGSNEFVLESLSEAIKRYGSSTKNPCTESSTREHYSTCYY